MSRDEPPVLTVAHRGASAYAPENTLAALRTAIEMRCDLAEVDVQRTRDGCEKLIPYWSGLISSSRRNASGKVANAVRIRPAASAPIASRARSS